MAQDFNWLVMACGAAVLIWAAVLTSIAEARNAERDDAKQRVRDLKLKKGMAAADVDRDDFAEELDFYYELKLRNRRRHRDADFDDELRAASADLDSKTAAADDVAGPGSRFILVLIGMAVILAGLPRNWQVLAETYVDADPARAGWIALGSAALCFTGLAWRVRRSARASKNCAVIARQMEAAQRGRRLDEVDDLLSAYTVASRHRQNVRPGWQATACFCAGLFFFWLGGRLNYWWHWPW